MTERDFVKHYGSGLSTEEDFMEAERFHELLLKTLDHFRTNIVEETGRDPGMCSLVDFAEWLGGKANE